MFLPPVPKWKVKGIAELHINGPQADFSPGPDCYQRCEDWAGEVKALLKGPLSTKSQGSTGKLCEVLAGKMGGTHNKSLWLTEAQVEDSDILLKKFKDQTKPKSNKLLAATAFRFQEQGNSTFSDFIDKTSILCDQCYYPKEVCESLLQDAIIIGLDPERHTSSALRKDQPSQSAKPMRLLRMKKSHQAKWATCNQSLAATKVRQQSTNCIEREDEPSPRHKPQPGQQKGGSTNQKLRQPKKKSCYSCGAEPLLLRSECPSKNATCYKCSKKDTTAVYADPGARMSKFMRHRHSQQQHNKRTAFPKSMLQCTPMLISTP